MSYSDVKINGRSVDLVKLNGKVWWQRTAPPVVTYRYIDPIDPVEYPNHTGLKIITLDGSENWKSTGGRMYTEDFRSILNGVTKAEMNAYCAEFVFHHIYTIADLTFDGFIVWASSDPFDKPNLTFKKTGISQATAWVEYLEDNPITVLISTNDPDESVWKPAVRISDGATGYWDGEDGFVAVKGGIPYYGDNLITQDVIDGAYDNAWISSQYAWATASSSVSFPVPVTVGKRYRIAWDTTDSDTVGTIFRYGFTNNNTPGSSNTLSSPRDRTTPQDVESVEVEASKNYLIIQVASGTFPGNTAHLTIREMVGYEDPVMLMMGGNPNPPEPEPEPEEEEGEE